MWIVTLVNIFLCVYITLTFSVLGLHVGADTKVKSRQLGRETYSPTIFSVWQCFVWSTATQLANNSASTTPRQLHVSYALGRIPYVWLHWLSWGKDCHLLYTFGSEHNIVITINNIYYTNCSLSTVASFSMFVVVPSSHYC